MHDTDSPKNLQRQAGITARNALEKDMARVYNSMISEKLLQEPAFAKAETIFSYQAFGSEVNPSLFHKQALCAGKKLAFPICYNKGLMVAALPHTPEDWETGKLGIKTPVRSRSTIIEPLAIDMVIVPCIAFDGSTKRRIGWGAGYYDRFLPLCKNAVTIAVAYEVQHIPGLCYDEWDVALDIVVTECYRY